MPQIIPIKELKNTAEISDMCHKSEEPIYVTKNGYGDMVIMSIELYKEQMFMLEVENKLGEAEKQIQEGDTLEGDASIKAIREKYNV